MFNKNKKNNKGFTLVELLVVIAIIGILAVVAVPSLMKNIEKSKVASLESDVSAIKSATLSYYAEHNSYPTTSNIVTTDGLSQPFDELLEGGLANKYKAEYAITGNVPESCELEITIPSVISSEAETKLENDLGADVDSTTTGSTVTVTLINGEDK